MFLCTIFQACCTTYECINITMGKLRDAVPCPVHHWVLSHIIFLFEKAAKQCTYQSQNEAWQKVDFSPHRALPIVLLACLFCAAAINTSHPYEFSHTAFCIRRKVENACLTLRDVISLQHFKKANLRSTMK